MRTFSPQNIDYIWSEMYIDAMVARLKTGQTLYVQHDANFNATAITNTSGVVQERFVYDAYGAATFLDPNWSVDTDGSDFGWIYLHQGGRYEANSGTYHFRHRDVSPTLGRPIQADPLGYPDGMNRYEWEGGNPMNRLDPEGLQVNPDPNNPNPAEPLIPGKQIPRPTPPPLPTEPPNLPWELLKGMGWLIWLNFCSHDTSNSYECVKGCAGSDDKVAYIGTISRQTTDDAKETVIIVRPVKPGIVYPEKIHITIIDTGEILGLPGENSPSPR